MKKYLYLIMAAIFTACGSAKIALDNNEWSKSEEFSVKGRQGIMIKQKLSFGNYRTVSVKRSWTKGSSYFAGWATGRPGYNDYERVIGTEYSQRKQTIRFEMTDDKGNESSFFCLSMAKEKDFMIGNNPNSLINILLDISGKGDLSENTYWTKIFINNQSRSWEMLLDNEAVQRNSKSYTGIVAQSRDNYYTIHPVYKITGKNDKVYTMPVGSVGFELRNKEGKPVAAVSVIDKGAVYLNSADPGEKFLVSNICAAILLRESI
jgi:hypothetical protein